MFARPFLRAAGTLITADLHYRWLRNLLVSALPLALRGRMVLMRAVDAGNQSLSELLIVRPPTATGLLTATDLERRCGKEVRYDATMRDDHRRAGSRRIPR